jgi:hypothetical protein
MTDLEIYLSHCYHVLLSEESEGDDIAKEERCACAHLIEYQDKTA